ncbi:MAG: hypothetical protein GY714_18915 [Desulfobacterales bacterium]|nr:hypothetical protein [Desulfobacterales bacterium]MCP4160645.1 hypothetical protein [Deltaproteobacteria bacterium]
MSQDNMLLFSIGAILVLVLTVLSVTAFQHAVKKDYGSTKKRAIWSLIAIFPFIGWIVYFLFGFRKGVKINFDQ